MAYRLDYYMNPTSPWTFLGHARLREICALHNVAIALKPVDVVGRVFPASGGLPLAKRAPQRQQYRLIELERWAALRELPLKLQPKHFPVPGHEASRLIIACDQVHDTDEAMELAYRLMYALWCQDRDLEDPKTLQQICREAELDPNPLFQRIPDTHQVFDAYTKEAIAAGVFGMPWYVYRGQPFWGQDRLELMAAAMARD
ncbi:MAG: 2-hydroxychromene-2-carboxylate isomerase [Burkholderiales bacterium]|nr:MAG: 2-hydroxychromene-2-carboxylate isomerase [Burkholderiales bacterium]